MRASPAAGDGMTAGSMVAGIIRGWDRFWFTPADPTTLGFIRLFTGLLVFYVHLTYSWGLLAYLGGDAWIDHKMAIFTLRDIDFSRPSMGWDGSWEKYTQGNYFWSIFFHVTDPGAIVALHVAFLITMLLFAAGLWTRWTGAITWLAAVSYVQRASSTVFGLDTMMMITLLYLNIGPSGAALSLDRLIEDWRARRRGLAPPPIEPSVTANFAIRLLQLHFCVVYFASGTSKMLGSTWWSGSALNLVLLNPSFAPMDWGPYFGLMKYLASHRLLWEVFTTGGILFTIFMEVGFVFLIWDMRWRWAMICGSVMLHLGIAFGMGLTTFSLMMIIMVSSFIPPEVIRQAVTRLEARWRQRQAARGSRGEAPATKELVGARYQSGGAAHGVSGEGEALAPGAPPPHRLLRARPR